MRFDFGELPAAERYKLMSSAITPRPIAWVTSLSPEGVHNAAPYSFFNMMGSEPPLVAIGMMRRTDGSLKDSARNVLMTGEFVLNMVTEADAPAMNFTCIDAPPEFDELVAAGIATQPSHMVAPPRIATAPVSMECRLFHSIEAGQTTIIVGEVLQFHITNDLIDSERLHVDTVAMRLVARMHGAGWYTRCTDLFQQTRPVYDEWLKANS